MFSHSFIMLKRLPASSPFFSSSAVTFFHGDTLPHLAHQSFLCLIYSPLTKGTNYRVLFKQGIKVTPQGWRSDSRCTSACLASLRPWVQTPMLKKKKSDSSYKRVVVFWYAEFGTCSNESALKLHRKQVYKTETLKRYLHFFSHITVSYWLFSVYVISGATLVEGISVCWFSFMPLQRISC
jgi:hypothetical protein